MNSQQIVALPILFLASILPSCKDQGASIQEQGVSTESRPAGLYARVLNASGNVVSGVSAHYIFYTSTNPVILDSWIQYGLLIPQVVTLKVFDPFGREVATLLNGWQQDAGQHSILFESPVTNGVYSYKLQTGDSLRTSSFIIRDDDIARLAMKPALTESDQRGEFFLSPSVLGISRSFQGQYGTETISDSIAVVLARENYRNLVQPLRLSMANPTDRTFVLESLPPPVNLIANPNFDLKGIPSVYGWVVPGTTSVLFSSEIPPGNSGHSVVFRANNLGYPWPDYCIYTLITGLSGSHLYRLSVYGKGGPIPTGVVRAHLNRPNGQTSSLFASLRILNSTWTRYYWTDTLDTTPSDTIFVTISGESARGTREILNYFTACMFEKID